MRDRISLTNRQKAGWILALWALLMVRACAAGLEYWPQLDDYIQYHNYPTAESFSALQKAVGLLAAPWRGSRTISYGDGCSALCWWAWLSSLCCTQ